MSNPSRSHQIDKSNLTKLYIGGNWVEPSTDKKFDVMSPVSEEIIFQVAEGTIKDIDLAVSKAHEAFETGPWPKMSPVERAKTLQTFADELRKRSKLFAIAWTETTGVVASMSENSLEYAVTAVDRSIEQASSFSFIEKHAPEHGGNMLVHEPVGVVAAIAPWNAPLASMMTKVGPALVAGCSVIMKPAPQTPIEAYLIAESAHAAGFPKGVINLVTADRDASDYLVRHPDVDKVSFTGSVATGKRIASVCADRVARVTLELGGKSAAIILDDYDLKTAADNLAGAMMVLNGQNCAALTRIIISRDHHDEFVDYLVTAMESKVIGNPYDPKTDIGPITMKSQLEKIESYIKIGIEEGAVLACGGKRPESHEVGYYFEPTVLAHVNNNMRVAREEIFGPVLCVIPCDGEEDAVRIANDSPFGLGGAVYTNDNQKAYEIARKIRTGTFGQNGMRASFAISFGGFKQSGLGREGGLKGLLPYLEPKTIMLDEAPKNL